MVADNNLIYLIFYIDFNIFVLLNLVIHLLMNINLINHDNNLFLIFPMPLYLRLIHLIILILVFSLFLPLLISIIYTYIYIINIKLVYNIILSYI